MTKSCYQVTKSLFGSPKKIKSMTYKTTNQQFFYGLEVNLIVMEWTLWIFSMLVKIEA